MDSEKSKLILIAIAAIVISILIFFFLYKLFSDPEAGVIDTTPVSFPDSVERSDLQPTDEDTTVVVAPTSSDPVQPVVEAETETDSKPFELQGQTVGNWRDDVVSYSQQGSGITSSTAGEGSVSDLPDSVVNSETAISYDYSDYFPETVTLANGQTILLEDALDFEKYKEAINPIPSLAEEFNSVESCGTVEIPEGTSALKAFLNELDQSEAATCLGEAVLHDCDLAWVLVTTADQSPMWVYVAMRDDGVCGLGNTYQADSVNLCDMTATLNYITKQDYTFDDYVKSYTDQPGMIFKDIYSTDAAFMGVSNLDCQLHEV